MAYHFETDREAMAWLEDNGFELVRHFMGDDSWERKIGKTIIVFNKALNEVKVVLDNGHVVYSGFKEGVGSVKDFLFDTVCNIELIMFACQELSDTLNNELWPQRI